MASSRVPEAAIHTGIGQHGVGIGEAGIPFHLLTKSINHLLAHQLVAHGVQPLRGASSVDCAGS